MRRLGLYGILRPRRDASGAGLESDGSFTWHFPWAEVNIQLRAGGRNTSREDLVIENPKVLTIFYSVGYFPILILNWQNLNNIKLSVVKMDKTEGKGRNLFSTRN